MILANRHTINLCIKCSKSSGGQELDQISGDGLAGFLLKHDSRTIDTGCHGRVWFRRQDSEDPSQPLIQKRLFTAVCPLWRTRALTTALACTPVSIYLCVSVSSIRKYGILQKPIPGWLILAPAGPSLGNCGLLYLYLPGVCFVVGSDKRLLPLHLGHKLMPLATVCWGGSMSWTCLTFLSFPQLMLFANWHTQMWTQCLHTQSLDKEAFYVRTMNASWWGI